MNKLCISTTLYLHNRRNRSKFALVKQKKNILARCSSSLTFTTTHTFYSLFKTYITMIQYVIRSFKNPRSGQVKLYPQMAPTTPVLRKELIREIEKTTVLASADIKACLDALEQKIVDHLIQGQTVRLGDLGSFRPTLTSKGKDEPEQVKTSDIKNVRVRFTKGAWLSKNLVPAYCQFRRTDANGYATASAPVETVGEA